MWEGDRNRKMHFWVWKPAVWVCIYTVLATFGLAGARLHRGKRIWQACLLSPQNNCLRITWGKSRWRYLEMTLPGDSLNHVHIRSGCYFACICVCVYLCGDPGWYAVSLEGTCAWPLIHHANTHFEIHHQWLGLISACYYGVKSTAKPCK